jgi:arylsulfatase A-like enzyme
VYPLLGFDRTVWLYGEAGVPRGDRGNWPSDDAIVDAVIRTSEEKRPFFIFAFPASSHSPYDFGAYRDSALDVHGAPTRPAAAEVKEYANAIRIADRAVGRLIEHFRGRKDSTLVVVLGDHLPPLTSDAVRTLTDRAATLPAGEGARALLRVPLLVWANYRLPREQRTLSLNMIAPYLLEQIGAPRRGLFAITDSLRRTIPVAGTVVEDTAGRVWLPDSVPTSLRGMLEDYRVLQHDALFGRRLAP